MQSEEKSIKSISLGFAACYQRDARIRVKKEKSEGVRRMGMAQHEGH